MKVSIRDVRWKHCWRIIPTRYPSEKLLDRVVDQKDLPAIEQLDALTSTRARLEQEDFTFLPSKEHARGPGSKYIMASFAYSLHNKTRFSDGSYGVYYGANELRTAIRETVFHREEFMRATSEGAMMMPMRVLDACLNGELHDLRGLKSKYPSVYHPKDYTAAQDFSRNLRKDGSNGIVYDSVRHHKGECAAVFKPLLLSHCREERTLVYEWDGRKISAIHEWKEFLKIE